MFYRNYNFKSILQSIYNRGHIGRFSLYIDEIYKTTCITIITTFSADVRSSLMSTLKKRISISSMYPPSCQLDLFQSNFKCSIFEKQIKENTTKIAEMTFTFRYFAFQMKSLRRKI